MLTMITSAIFKLYYDGLERTSSEGISNVAPACSFPGFTTAITEIGSRRERDEKQKNSCRLYIGDMRSYTNAEKGV